MAIVYQKSAGLTDIEMHYCPGCTHGVIHKLIAEAMVDMDLLDNAVGVAPVGCSVFAYNYFNCDMHEAAHGRAPAVATGIKRVLPESHVFTYQGDGDLAAIGTGEIIHAAMRGEHFTTIFVNNAIYGMTGGQMAPTTLVGQKATTAPHGRDRVHYGQPLHMAEIIGTIGGCAYSTRVTVVDMKSMMQARQAIRKAFKMQQEKKGFTFVEVLSTCPTNWGMTPVEALSWVKDTMVQEFPLGTFKDIDKKETP